MRHDIVTLFVILDEFCKKYEEEEKRQALEGSKGRSRPTQMSLSEMMLIEILFQTSQFKNFKSFYTNYLPLAHHKDFPNLLSYSRFVQLKPRLFKPLTLFLDFISGEKTGVYTVDSTVLPVCHNKRIYSHKVFKGIAERGKSTMGWFYGLKLHLIINDKREIVAVKVTAGNKDDRKALQEMSGDLRGRIYGDKGYLSKSLFKVLWSRGLKLVTGIRKNMKNVFMEMVDKVNLRKRGIIETIFGQLKINYCLHHTRSRSPINFCVNILSAIAALQLNSNNHIPFIQN